MTGLSFRPAQPDSIIIFDDPAISEECGVAVTSGTWGKNLDFVVAWSDNSEVQPGDRILLDDPQAGTKLSVDNVPYRVVPLDSVIAVLSHENTPTTAP